MIKDRVPPKIPFLLSRICILLKIIFFGRILSLIVLKLMQFFVELAGNDVLPGNVYSREQEASKSGFSYIKNFNYKVVYFSTLACL